MDESELLKERFKSAVSSAVKVFLKTLILKLNLATIYLQKKIR